jgi:hypothetical protein
MIERKKELNKNNQNKSVNNISVKNDLEIEIMKLKTESIDISNKINDLIKRNSDWKRVKYS